MTKDNVMTLQCFPWVLNAQSGLVDKGIICGIDFMYVERILPIASGALQSTAMAGFSSLTTMLSFIVRPKSATFAFRWLSRSTFLAARSL